jgi:DNA helicase HerA-like ATPase
MAELGTRQLQVGSFVTLTSTDGVRQLGQIDGLSVALGEALHGSGRILGAIGADGRLDGGRSVAFIDAALGDAAGTDIELLYGSDAATLAVGTYLTEAGVPARVLAQKFNRHTFWCGQSGSGKTYALGVLLEQLLIHTRLPMVIFDPNSDFVRLGELTPAGEESASGRVLSDRTIRVLRQSSPDPDSLRVRFLDLPLRAKGAVLHLDPLSDRAEYNEMVHLEATLSSMNFDQLIPTLMERATPAAVALAGRIENLKVMDFGVWAGGFEAVTDIVDTRPDATVLDLGGFAYADESLVVAMAVLDDLWAKRETRRPLLIVIDEAHNLCSPEHDSPLHIAVRERIIQIAAEGRKFGLWLLLSTQRPSRIHSSIISQCDNLALMKMTSPADLGELADVFGFVPPAMFAQSPGFRQGEALFAGGFVPAPATIRMGARLTREGGADVRVPLRET